MGVDGDDTGEHDLSPEYVIEEAAKKFEELEAQLIELQKKCLARGTRDVLLRAREAVHAASAQMAEEAEKDKLS